MTEQEWLECGEPERMLELLLSTGPNESRRFRLVACACVWRIWHLLADQRSKTSMRVAEQYADGKTSDEELEAVFIAAATQDDGAGCQVPLELDSDAAAAASWTAAENYQQAAYRAATHARCAVGKVSDCPWNEAAVAIEGRIQSDLIRDIFGNPFRPVSIHPIWRTPTVDSIARSIYAERAFDRLPILADALEDAGCDNADMLNHCRQPGEHVRGCWVVDLVLGKK